MFVNPKVRRRRWTETIIVKERRELAYSNYASFLSDSRSHDIGTIKKRSYMKRFSAQVCVVSESIHVNLMMVDR